MTKTHRGKDIGYVRVSSAEQNEARQLEGLGLDRTFTDKLSGKDMNRPQLSAALEYLRDGDTLFVHSMDRLARNLDDLRKIVLGLTERGVHVSFVKEGLLFTGEDSPMSNLLLSVMGAFAEFERSLIRERQREGIAAAKKAGVYKGRRPKLNEAMVIDLKRRAANGEKRAMLAREFKISRETLYTYLEKPTLTA
ncbi:recombinase family protein [Terriglobus saanensis]|uniref:recombinase family protein n=1 Tax=Terriglobus saanensis TaxID=870903 RepID=UPI0024784660|nr:recombinase family protein [Terriglobus saanensis]